MDKTSSGSLGSSSLDVNVRMYEHQLQPLLADPFICWTVILQVIRLSQ
jgi:hypothetical protein